MNSMGISFTFNLKQKKEMHGDRVHNISLGFKFQIVILKGKRNAESTF